MLALVVLAMILVGGQSVSKGQSPPVINNYAENGIVLGGGQDAVLGATNTSFPHGIETTGLSVTNTSTFQEIGIGSRYSKALTFTAGATTTPGGLFTLNPPGTDLICNNMPQIDLTSQVEGSMEFVIGTSTSATAWSTTVGSTSGGSLMASTTAATGTKILLQKEAVGNAFPANSYLPRYWVWSAIDYVLGAFDKGSNTRNNATTTDYTTAAGKVYLDCHIK